MTKFSKKIERKSVSAIELDDLVRMRNYQSALLNTMLYEMPGSNGANQLKRTRIIAEIQRVEAWLKDSFKEFSNDNNRKIA